VEAAEKWYEDPRLAIEDQLEQAVFEKERPRIFDRGHMVRRLDPAWASAAMAQKASDDTFHFTNCCPQIAEFNQRARLWAGIEDYVLDNAKAEKTRICVFTGTVFRVDDPAYRDVAVPQAFWKILVRVEEGQLRATGFLADQGELLQRVFQQDGRESFDDLGHVAIFQARISMLEEQTGIEFAEITSHDTATLEAPQVEIIIRPSRVVETTGKADNASLRQQAQH
jgi:endonuclease G, mitochondrial